MTSLALLQQGQRTQRETNQYDIECESGPSLMQEDGKREKKKKEDADIKGREWSCEEKGRRKKNGKVKTGIRGMTTKVKGWKGGRHIQREIASHG